MAIGRCQPLYLSGAVFIDSDRSFSQEQLTKEHLLLVLTFISLRSSWPKRAFMISDNICFSQEQFSLIMIGLNLSFLSGAVDQRAFIISVNIYISQEQLTQESMEGVEAAEGQTSWGRPGAQVVLVLVIAVVRFCCYDCSCCCCSCSCHLLLLLQLSYFVVITVCDQPPEEGLGLKLSLFLLWFWLSIFVVVDANLGLRLLVFKQSCKAWCLNCCRSPEQRGLETAMADPNWKATSLWNRT